MDWLLRTIRKAVQRGTSCDMHKLTVCLQFTRLYVTCTDSLMSVKKSRSAPDQILVPSMALNFYNYLSDARQF